MSRAARASGKLTPLTRFGQVLWGLRNRPKPLYGQIRESEGMFLGEGPEQTVRAAVLA